MAKQLGGLPQQIMPGNPTMLNIPGITPFTANLTPQQVQFAEKTEFTQYQGNYASPLPTGTQYKHAEPQAKTKQV
jgi:hypothetical protein